jgi:hypothetical protein
MKKFKILFLLLISIGLTSSLLAQVNESYYKRYKKEYADSLKKIYAAKRDSIINNAEFIFEGKPIQRGPLFFTDTGKTSCTIIRIDKIYRGNNKLKKGTIEIIVLNHTGIFVPENNIIFCNEIKNENTCFSKQIFDNSIKVVLTANISTVSPEREEMEGLFDLDFNSMLEARNYLSK